MLTITQKTVKGFVATDKVRPAMVGVHYIAAMQAVVEELAKNQEGVR